MTRCEHQRHGTAFDALVPCTDCKAASVGFAVKRQQFDVRFGTITDGMAMVLFAHDVGEALVQVATVVTARKVEPGKAGLLVHVRHAEETR